MRIAALVVAAVAAAEEFRANLVPMIEATRWITDGGAPPAHWVVHGESDLDNLKQVKHFAISNSVKEVVEARFRNTSVVVKSIKDSIGGTGRLSRHLAGRHEALTEIVFLEYCRGGPGIPRLLGAYRNENGTVVWVVEKVGENIVKRIGRTRSESTNPEWRAFVEAAPLDAARAIFRCFRSLSEIGGFYIDDFHPGQFTFFEGALYVIDGVSIAGGPARDFVDNATNVARFVGKVPLNRPFFMQCLHSSKYKITYRKNFINKAETLSRNEKCRRAATNGHVTDVATKPFLLPFVIDRSAGDDRKKLEALSATMRGQTRHSFTRPSFTELLAALS